MFLLKLFEGKKYLCDVIQPSILFKDNHEISPVLSNVFNKCILRGVFPYILKQISVVQIFISGDSNMASNYRPISTRFVFNKVFEKLIHLRLSKFITKYNVISDT